jgi:uncharacterized protein YbaR (Trm112 family)
MGPVSGIGPELLAILVCPRCHAQLRAMPPIGPAETLNCSGQGCGLRYPVRDGIPVLLVDEADGVDHGADGAGHAG